MFEKISSESNSVGENLKPQTPKEVWDNLYGGSEQLETGENFESTREYPSTFDDATPRVKDVFAEYWNDLSISERDDDFVMGDREVLGDERKKFFDEKFKKLESLLDPELPDNVHEMETDWANIRLIYEWHGQQMPVSTVVGLDVICAEGSLFSGSTDVVKTYLKKEEIPFGATTDDDSDALVVAVLKDLHIPVILNDVHGKELHKIIYKELDKSQDLEKKLAGLTVVATATALTKLLFDLNSYLIDKKYPNLQQNEEFSRRKFLKFMGKNVLVGVAGVSGMVSFSSDIPVEKKSIQSKMSKIYTRTLESVGYSQVVLSFRNAVMAQRIYDIALAQKNKVNNSKKPYIGMQLGAAHTTIEQMLKMSESERLEIIEKIIELLLRQGIEFNASFKAEFSFDDNSDAWQTNISDNEKIANIVKKVESKIYFDKLNSSTESVNNIRDIVNEARIK